MNLKKIYQERYDDLKWRQKLWQVLVESFFQQFINKKDTVVDIGCGYGEFINQIRCRKKLAVDLNTEAKKHLKQEIIFYRASSTKMPFLKKNSIDKIFVSNFFEHLTRSDIIATIKEFKRILKKGGQVLILQPNIRLIPNDYWQFFDHLTPIDDRALEEIFLTFGFKLKKRILRFLPYTTKSNFPRAISLVKLYLKLPFFWHFFGRQSFLIFEK
ncbi:MAG: class I SAM-dependent methyltransferase [Microgenomates group bacterium]|nr:class I SAM-dependent methyltransferase [Microgenomates group bacterium]